MSPDFWTAYWSFVAFVFGAIVGSFLNVCIWRLPRGESLSAAPSHCPSCEHQLRFFPDMVPMFSQLWSRGRCRYCGTKYSWRYFWVELLTALIFTALYLRFVPFGPETLSESVRNTSALLAMLFFAALITIFFIDLDTYEIPDIVTLTAALLAIGKDVVLIAVGHHPLWQQIPGTPWSVPIPLSILTGLIALWLLWQFAALSTAVLAREAMGAGDSLLLAAMGCFLIPWPLLALAFMVAVLLGTVGGLTGIWLAGRQPEPAPSDGDVSDSEPAGATLSEEMPAAARIVIAEGAEQEEGAPSSGEAVGVSRGMLETSPPTGDGGVPVVPAAARWGRVVTVFGTWLALAAVWGGAVLASANLGLGIGVGVALAVAAVVALRFGLKAWISSDEEWLSKMDEVFESDPGPRFIPFGPYLVAGTLVATLFGHSLLELYWKWMMLPPIRLPWD
jgi:leader peptidase (prepilin peptidase)/N-methyltransferase